MPADPTLDVLICAPIMGRDLSPVRAVAPNLKVVDGNDAFIAFNRACATQDADELAAATATMRTLLEPADVLCMMYPMMQDAAAMAPKLRWLHHTQAGVSNLWPCDVWQASDIVITSGRGHVRTTAIAEYVIAAVLAFARGLHDGYVDKLAGRIDPRHYAPSRIEGATLGIVGLGGIGREVARLARALGMRIVATRRSASAPQQDVDGADLLLPPWELHRLAAESDFIAVCTALTRATENLINAAFFAATTRNPLLVNISRGEVIDEPALLAALDAGTLRGAVLDVYAGELERAPPRPEFLTHTKIVLTPHISGLGTASDSRFMELFCENLRRYVGGEPLLNLVDRQRGY